VNIAMLDSLLPYLLDSFAKYQKRVVSFSARQKLSPGPRVSANHARICMQPQKSPGSHPCWKMCAGAADILRDSYSKSREMRQLN